MPQDSGLVDLRRRFRELKRLAEQALVRLGEDDFYRSLEWQSNSPALIVKHVAGHLRSRWTDFLTSDGEKPDRKRDREFKREPSDSRASLMDAWEEGWAALLTTLDALGPEDLERTITIRGEPHSVAAALNRGLSHQSYHVGQIVLLAKHYRFDSWSSLSIPRDMSEQYGKEIRDKHRD
jgi:uncharacterized damage-inducible protein DinB